MPNVTATVKIDGVDEAVDKAHELIETIKKQKGQVVGGQPGPCDERLRN